MTDSIDLLKQKLLKESDPLVKASILKNLNTNFGVTTKELAKKMKVSEPYVSSMMRLLKLPELVVDGYYSHSIKLTHLLVLSRLDDTKEMVQAFEQVLMKSLSTQATDDLVRHMKYSISADVSGRIQPEVVDRIKSTIEQLDPTVSVKIIQTRIRMKIIIEKKGTMSATSKFIHDLSNKL